VGNAAPLYRTGLKEWIRFNHGLLAAVLVLSLLWGVARAWSRDRRKLSLQAKPLTPEEVGLLNVIRLSANRF
jgi:heme A synthase